MNLTVDLSGLKNRIVIRSIPKAFVSRIFKHCRGKNNTPYFANNCFKGILYFDNELARKYAESVGFSWTNWDVGDIFSLREGYCLECNLEVAVSQDDGPPMNLHPSELTTEVSEVALEPYLAKTGPDEVIILLGSVDKGREGFELENVEGDFDLDKLVVRLDGFEDFFFRDRIVQGMSYAGREMNRLQGPSIGKNMIPPLMFDNQGHELEMDDFPG